MPGFQGGSEDSPSMAVVQKQRDDQVFTPHGPDGDSRPLDDIDEPKIAPLAEYDAA